MFLTVLGSLIVAACASVAGAPSTVVPTPIASDPAVEEPRPVSVGRYARYPDMFLGQLIIACGIVGPASKGRHILYAGGSSAMGIYLADGLGELVPPRSIQCVRGHISRLDGLSFDEARRANRVFTNSHLPNSSVILSGAFTGERPDLARLARPGELD